MTTLTATDAGNQPMVRRSAHAWTVGVAMASPAALWAVAVPLLGAQNGDRPPPQVGLTAVCGDRGARVPGRLGAAGRARMPARPGRTVWTVATVAVLMVSFGPLLVPGATTMTTSVTLALMAMTAAAVLVPGLRRSSPVR